MTLLISGIPVEICKKSIKNLHLYVKPPNGYVTVSAPHSMSDEAIERFVRTKLSWIKKQIVKFGEQPRQSERKYVSGEILYVWGNHYVMEVEYGNKNSVTLSDGKAILTVRKGSKTTQRDNFVKEWYRELLKTAIECLLPKWEKITGLQASSWQTKYMTTRWGTCNYKTRKLWFNLQLAKETPICLEYIILHELIHITEKKHNKRFFALMDKYMPMWREVKATLNGSKLDYMKLTPLDNAPIESFDTL